MVAHHFDDEDSPFCSGRRLPDSVANSGDLVESRVRPETELGPGHVVADRCRNDYYRNLKFGKFVPVPGKGDDRSERGEPADEQEAVDVVSLQLKFGS